MPASATLMTADESSTHWIGRLNVGDVIPQAVALAKMEGDTDAKITASGRDEEEGS